MTNKSNSELLADYVNILNKYGKDSDEAKQFLSDNINNKEVISLARIARKLKAALNYKRPAS